MATSGGAILSVRIAMLMCLFRGREVLWLQALGLGLGLGLGQGQGQGQGLGLGLNQCLLVSSSSSPTDIPPLKSSASST
jgi:hypothetical protein